MSDGAGLLQVWPTYFEGTNAAEIGKEDLFLLVINASGAFKGHLYVWYGYRQFELLFRI